MSAAITPTTDITDPRIGNQAHPEMETDHLISFDGQIMTPPRNDFTLAECQKYSSVPTIFFPTPAPPSVSVTDPDPIIAQDPGENFVTAPVVTEPSSGEKPLPFEPNSGEKPLPFEPTSEETSGQSGENIPLFSFPETHAPAAAAHVHQSYPDVPKDFWDNRYDHNFDTTPSMGPTCRVGIALTSSEIETFHHQQHLDYVRSIIEPDIDVDSEFFQVLAVTNHMIRHKNTPEEMVKLQVLFMTGEKHWYPIDIIRMESPMIIVEYALQNHLVSQRHFKWITSFCNNNDLESLILKAKLAGREPMTKFGVQVLGVQVPMGLTLILRFYSHRLDEQTTKHG